MGYGMQIPAYRIGGQAALWDIRGYELSEVWVKRVTTLPTNQESRDALERAKILLGVKRDKGDEMTMKETHLC